MKWKWTTFFKEAISVPYDKKKPIRSFFHKIIRITFLSLKSFFENELYIKSALLTFYSIISIVPILAIVFAIARGFGFEEFLEKQILVTFKEQQDVISVATRFAYAFIGHIKSQTVVGAGVLILFFSVFGLFENLERSLNSIWNVQKPRKIFRRVINHIMALIFFPVVFLASTSITIFIHSQIIKTSESYEFVKYFSDYVLLLLKLVPFGLICILFSYLYIFTPNTKLSIKPRIIAGIFAGIIFQFWQILYIEFQLYISSYSIIYGSFAALPLFLIWMQVNFVIFLFGAEIAAQMEGDQFFEKETSKDHFKIVHQKILCLLVLREITLHFLKGEGPLPIDYLTRQLGISILDARDVLNILEKGGFVAEITTKSLEQYQLIINPELFTVQAVCDGIDKILMKKMRSKDTTSLYSVSHWFSKIEKVIEKSGYDLNLKEFANFK